MKRKILRQVLLSILMVSGFKVLVASNSQLNPLSDSFTIDVSFEHDDPGAYSWDVVWDEHGVAYIGRDRLWRWDGQDWSVHGPENLRILRGLEIGPNEKLWLGGYNSLGYFDLNTLKYRSILDKLPQNLRNLGEVWKLYHDGDSLWVGTTTKLIKVSEAGIEHWDFEGDHRILFHFLESGVYAHQVGKGIWKIKGNSKHLYCDDKRVSKYSIVYLAESENNILTAVSGNGIFEIKDGEVILYNDLSAIEDRTFSCGIQLETNSLIVGTVGSGVFSIGNVDGETVINQWNETLRNDTVLALAKGPRGEIWSLNLSGIRLTFPELSANIINSNVLRDAGKITDTNLLNGELVISTSKGCYRAYEDKLNRFKFKKLSEGESWKIITNADAIFFDDYDSICRFRNESVEDLFVFNKSFKSFDLTEAGLLHVNFHDELVSYRVGEGNELTELNSYKDSIAFDELETDNRGVTWGWSVDTPVYEIEVTEQDEVHIIEHAEVAGVQLQEISSRITMTNEGPVIVTKEGIIRRDTRSGLWVFGELGVGMGVPLAGEFRDIDSGLEGWLVYKEPSTGNDLLISVEWKKDHDPEWRILPWLNMRELGKIHKIKYFEETEPVLAIIGMNGLLLADPQLSDSIPVPRRPVISDAKNSLPVRTANKLEFDEQGMRLKFSSPGHELYGPVRYQTRIVGLDDKWSEPDEFTDKEIGQLLEGNYRFEVRALDPFGRTSQVSGVDIEILPPWYRTIWAYGIFFFGPLALFGVLGFGYLKYHVYRMRIRQVELEILVEERTVELKRANSVKDDFIANLSHEIRNPLNGVIGLIRQLREGVAPSGRNVVALRGAASYLQRTVEDVLDVSKLETGEIPVNCRTFDLVELVAGVIQIYRDEANEKGLVIEYGISKVDGIQIVSDDGKLQQILGNLVNNAVKFTETGTIEVQVGLVELETGHAVHFKVKDTGCGITESDREKVFEKFYQSKSDKSSVSGTGLGLTLVNAFTNLLGGSLEMHSEVGSGTEFNVSIPVKISESQQTEDVADMVDTLGLSVLIVEDMEYNRLYLEDFLEKLGCTVRSIEDGLIGLQTARDNEFDVILLDWELPGMKGFEISKTLRSMPDFPEQTRIIAMTAYATPDVQEKCFEVGMNAFLSKPLELKELHRELVRRYIVGRGNLGEMNFDGGWEHHKKRWLKIFNEHVEEVREDFENSDVEAVAKNAHKLLGHLRMIKTVEIGDCFLDLMTAANAGDLKGAEMEWEQISEMLPWLLKEYRVL